jgi:hypothetical protein
MSTASVDRREKAACFKHLAWELHALPTRLQASTLKLAKAPTVDSTTMRAMRRRRG